MKTSIFAAVAAATIAAVPASAVTVANATSIRVTSAAPDYLQIAEVQAFNFGAVNVALGASAVGSSTYDSTSTAGKAIDGNTGGNFYSDTIFHSLGGGAGEFLQLSFAPTSLSSLTIFGRSDCCSQRDIYNVEIFSGVTLLYSGVLNADTPTHSATVLFDAVGGAVPEPASWAMLVAGFGLVGASMRRRKSVAVSA